MRFWRLSDEDTNHLASTPEHLPNVCFVNCPEISEGPFVVVNDQILISPHETDPKSDRFLTKVLDSSVYASRSTGQDVDAFTKWAKEFDKPKRIVPLSLDPDQLAWTLFKLGFLSAHTVPTAAPSGVATPYGHLPWTGKTGPADVYYRCEAFPISKRVVQSTDTISKNTFAFPASELPFVPTGLAAVARYSLPSLFPAVYRWEIQPAPKTTIRFGACIPAFGQSGGGVEVCFDQLTYNRGPIANPVKLPVM